MPNKCLLVVDGYSLLFRAFYGTRFLSTADGRPTNALFGFVSMLFMLIDRHNPDCIVIALDAHGKTFRHEEFEEYKGTRRETPEELIQQLIGSRDLIAALGIPTIECPGFEADDVVGTIAKKAESHGYKTLIISGDMDGAQLVDEHITLITPKQGVTDVNIYDPDGIREKYGFDPEFIPDYKALVGDASDNIPGVKGIGPKGAAVLIQEYGKLEQILENLPQLNEKVRLKIEPFLDLVGKYKWLATIVTDAPVEFDCVDLKISPEQIEAATAYLGSLEMRNHAKRASAVLGRYSGESGKAAVQVIETHLEPTMGERLTDEGQFTKWLGEGAVAAVFEQGAPAATLLDEQQDGVAYLAMGNEVRMAPEMLAKQWLLARPQQWIAYDSKPLYHGSGQEIPPKFDAMLAAYVLQSGRTRYGLKEILQGYLDVSEPKTSAQLAVGLALVEKPMTERVKLEDQDRVLNEIETALVPILSEMEDRGIALNADSLHEFSKTLEVQIEQVASRIYEMAGKQFVIGSPRQLGQVLFEDLGLQSTKKTKTGQSTGVEVLQEMDHPIAHEVLAWRELSKLKSTYADALPKMVGADGRIHTTYNQTVAATGRLSSIDPNLQNIPIRSELGREIRRAFVPAKGFDLVSFDYSQIELRLLAHLCQDEALVTAFNTNVDVHDVTAKQIFGAEVEKVSKEQRRLAKMLNYAVLYGVTEYGLAQQLGSGFGVSEARELITNYNTRFPKVKGFTESVVEEARKKGFTSTLWGRRRYFPEIHAANRNERLYAERQAMNAPIQGAAADLIKLAMIEVCRSYPDVRMLLQVHDELVFELPSGDRSLVEPLRKIMEQAMPISVPIEVDAKIGANWSEMTVV